MVYVNGSMTKIPVTKRQVVFQFLSVNSSMRPADLSRKADSKYGMTIHSSEASKLRKDWFESQGKKAPKLEHTYAHGLQQTRATVESSQRTTPLSSTLSESIGEEGRTEQFENIKEFATIVKKVGGPNVAEKFLDLLKSIM